MGVRAWSHLSTTTLCVCLLGGYEKWKLVLFFKLFCYGQSHEVSDWDMSSGMGNSGPGLCATWCDPVLEQEGGNGVGLHKCLLKGQLQGTVNGATRGAVK